MKKEVLTHSKLHHPNVVMLIGMVFEENNYGVILEFMRYGALNEFLAEYKPNTSWKLKVACDIAVGMSYLHSRDSPIIHGDLKIHNILVGEGHKAKVGLQLFFSHMKSYLYVVIPTNKYFSIWLFDY